MVGDRLVITDYQTGDNVKVDNYARESFTGIERVHCLNSATGETIWTHEYPVTYTMSYPAGPRCTPVIHDGMVYTLGAEGHLICFELATGKIVWQKHFATDYAAKTPLSQAAAERRAALRRSAFRRAAAPEDAVFAAVQDWVKSLRPVRRGA